MAREFRLPSRPPPARAREPEKSMKLSGIRVIDLSVFLPGPHLSMMMADHGAEVIKIEVPGEGDPGRHIGLGEGGHTTFFRNANRGKKSVVLNLKDPAEREALLELARTADVFIEAFRPGVVKRLGVDYETVSSRNPRIVYASISAFGQTGPNRDLPAHDLAVEALSGVLSINLGSDDQPAMPGIPAADMAASLMAFGGIMMALLGRERTGRGDYLDISMQDSLMAWLPNVLGPVFVEKRAPVAKHERTWGGAAFYRIYRTRDGRHVVLGAQELKFVRNLLGELGRLDLVELAERGPGPHQQPLVDYLQAQFETRTQAEWVEWFRGRDIGFAPVRNLREAFDDDHVRERGMLLLDPEGIEHLGVPIRFKEEPGLPRFDVPSQGQHNDAVVGAPRRKDPQAD
jgi:crotonobetainyl-CoA:carnitine CoA-transferase CaiB-like acyl-CoA transferase